MQLSKNFTLAELTVTDTGLDNTPTEEQKKKLLFLVTYLLQPVRDIWGKLHVNSGFRSDSVNEKIGGAKTSQHKEAEAVDFTPEEADIMDVFKWCRENLKFGQLIIERKKRSDGSIAVWIHVSLPRLVKDNMEVMKFEDGKYSNI